MTPQSKFSYDSECESLARHFLSDEAELNTPVNEQELAQAIQDAVEDWFVGIDAARERDDTPPKRPPDGPSEAEIARSQARIAAVLGIDPDADEGEEF